MANRYWVGGAAAWDGTAASKWATSSGGGGGETVPTASDDVFFDAASGAVAVEVTVNSTPCLSLNFTGFTGTLSGNNSLHISGSLTYVAGMTLSYTGAMTFNATSGSHTVTTAGKQTRAMIFNGVGGTWTLQDNLTTHSGASVSLTNGTLDFNDFDVSTGTFGSSSNLTTRTLYMGSGTITLNSNGSVWNCLFTTGLTLNAETSTIKINKNFTSTFAGGSQTYNNIWITGTNANDLTISGSNTFNDFKNDKSVAHNLLFTAGTTQTVTTFDVSGSSGNVITINSTSTATHTLTKSGGGTIVCDYLNIQHSVATPSATWYSGANSVNNQDVATAGSGWVFPIAYALILSVGSYVLTGVPTIFNKGYALVCAVGAYTLTGISSLFGIGYTITCAVGAYTLTGIATTFNKGYTLVCAVGAYILTGVAATFSYFNLRSTIDRPRNSVTKNSTPDSSVVDDATPKNTYK